MIRTIRQKFSIFMWLVIAAFIVTIIFSWGMGGIKNIDPRSQGVIARVNGEDVQYAELKNIQENYFNQPKNKNLSGVKAAELRNKAWDDLIRMVVIRQELEKQNITVSPEQLYSEILNNPLPDLKQAPQFMTDGQFDLKKYQEFIKNPDPQYEQFYRAIEEAYKGRLPGMILEKRVAIGGYISEFKLQEMYRNQNLKAKVKFLKAETNEFMPADSTITDSEIEEYFKNNSHEFPKMKEKRSFEYVLFDTEPTEKDSSIVLEDINYAMKQIENGIPFENVARNYSEDNTASKGGDLGFFGRGKMVPAFEEAAFNASPGEIVGPVKTQYGYHIIKVDSLKKEEDKVTEVKASHILIKFKAHDQTFEDAQFSAVTFREQLRNNQDEEDSFRKTAKNLGHKVFEAPFTGETDRTNELGIMPGLGDFLFNNEPGTVSPLMVCDKGYAYLKIKEIKPEREQTLEEVKSRIIYELKKKKGLQTAFEEITKIQISIKDTTDMNSIAEAKEGFITGTSNRFSVNVYIDKVGVDRKMYEKAMAMDEGTFSKPFKGEQGAYIIYLIQKDEFDEEKYASEKKAFREKHESYLQRQMIQEWLSGIVEKADVEDLRKLYYR